MSELNSTRPSTRVRVAPGGASSITFGDPHSTTPSPMNSTVHTEVPAVVNDTENAITQSLEELEISDSTDKTITVLVSGKQSELIISSITLAFAKKSITGYNIIKVNEYLTLPYITQQFAKSSSAIIAATVFTSNSTNHINQAQSLINTIYNIGLTNSIPIIPGILTFDSLLEAKALVPNQAIKWANSVSTLLSLNNGEHQLTPEVVEVQIVDKVEIIADDTSVTPEMLLDDLRSRLKDHGATGIFGLARSFRVMDDDNSKSVNLEEFTKAIYEHTLHWSPAQIKIVFDSFDADKSGSISFDEFLIGVRGQLNDRRVQIVLQAFKILDSDKSGKIDLSDIKAKYDASKHPDVLSGLKSPDDVLSEFLSTFDTIDADGVVTPSEFVKYYSNVSSSIDDDDYFELVIRNAWHISGGIGWAANTTCRRVLVIHNDGRQTIEEVKNDIGIKATDTEAILANLTSQGITDVKSIDATGTSSDSSSSSTAAGTPAVPPTTQSNSTPAPPVPDREIRPAAGGRSNNHTNHDDRAIRPGTAASSYNPRRQVGGQSSIIFG